MNLLKSLLLLCVAGTITAQTNTEIHLFDLSKDGDKRVLSNGKNISNAEGYDSQPYFLSNNALIYAGTRDGNTEILQYTNGKEQVFNTTTEGGEYSPQPIPGGRAISAVRLDPDGHQRLYSYTARGKESTALVKDAVVAYYAWHDDITIVAADIVDNDLHLVIHDISQDKSNDLGISVGRSFHNIPNTELISFVDKTEDVWVVKSINPKTLEIKEITPLIPGLEIEDIAWLPDGSLLATMEDTIIIKRKDSNWAVFHLFDDDNLKNLSRIAVSPDGSQLAIVSEVSPAEAVDKHIQPFNSRDLEAFSNSFTEDVVVRNYFSDTLYIGRDRLRQGYKNYFERTPSSHVEVLNRIVYKKIVIDEEKVTVNGKIKRQATIYEVRNGKIASMTFIQNSKTASDPTPTVEAQLKTYNNRDLDGFMKLYTEDIMFFKYPTVPEMTTREAVQETYKGIFNQTPDLNAVIKNRIVIGNLVIDYEKVSGNGDSWYGLVINDVVDGKINRIVFF